MSFVCRWVGIPIVPMRSVLKRVGDPGSIGLDVNLVRDVRPRYALSEKNHSPRSVFVLQSISPRIQEALGGVIWLAGTVLRHPGPQEMFRD